MVKNVFLWFMVLCLSLVCAEGTGSEKEPGLPLKFIRAENLVRNPDFEEGEELPASWNWGISRNAKATCGMDNGVYYSGKRAVRLASASDFGPHVYGGLQQDIPVEPNTGYILSIRAKAESQENAWFGGGPGWAVRKGFPSGSFDWTRFELEFRTGKETAWPLRIDVDGITKGLWIDEVRLARSGEGDIADISYRARPFSGPAADKSSLKINKNEFLIGESLEAEFCLLSAKDLGEAELEFGILDKEGKKYAEFPAQEIEIKKGENITTLQLNTKNISAGAYRFSAGAPGKKKEEVFFTVYSAEQAKDKLLARISGLEENNNALKVLAQDLENKGIDCSYQKVAVTVAENFLKYVSQDLTKREIKRAQDAVDEIDTMLKETKKDLDGIAAGGRKVLEVPRYVPTSSIKIEGPCFIAATKTLSGRAETRPVFFTGYGAFGQVRADIEKFPGYGINIIQIEFGPNSVFPSEGKVSDAAVKDFLKVADRAQANNVAINLLLSPHYFPEWVKNKYPHLKSCSGGFLQYCIDAPESRRVLEDFIRFVIPMVKDHPALHSVCLSNEPVYTESRECEFTKNMWREWLQKKHGSIGTLNKNYGTSYSSFDDVPAQGSNVKEKPVYYDWAVFNAERFAGWHKFMADIIHEVAPDLPVHAKIMMWCPVADRGTTGWGIDPELFGELSQINGNDCCKWYARDGEYCSGWQVENMAYDLQRSVADKPVFNSENHLIMDRDFGYIPSAHVRNVLWQGAIHGQGATTIWVWERTYCYQRGKPGCGTASGCPDRDHKRGFFGIHHSSI
ncbi:hypothetical protein AUJ67_08280 [Candidatus Desantisbacteria bacterium CG1_02_49_89]|nr:MAG: hypothetical protein AUJ67_08280 [Candidatus Desantisbacteria bacterium CG1_02_49_89]